MQEAAAVQAAALEAVEDVDPRPVYDRIAELLDGGSMAPGVFTIACANAILKRSGRTVEDLDADDAIIIGILVEITHPQQLISVLTNQCTCCRPLSKELCVIHLLREDLLNHRKSEMGVLPRTDGQP